MSITLQEAMKLNGGRRLDSDPIAAKVLDRIYRKAPEGSPEGVVRGPADAGKKSERLGAGVRRTVVPAETQPLSEKTQKAPKGDQVPERFSTLKFQSLF